MERTDSSAFAPVAELVSTGAPNRAGHIARHGIDALIPDCPWEHKTLGAAGRLWSKSHGLISRQIVLLLVSGG